MNRAAAKKRLYAAAPSNNGTLIKIPKQAMACRDHRKPIGRIFHSGKIRGKHTGPDAGISLRWFGAPQERTEVSVDHTKICPELQ